MYTCIMTFDKLEGNQQIINKIKFLAYFREGLNIWLIFSRNFIVLQLLVCYINSELLQSICWAVFCQQLIIANDHLSHINYYISNIEHKSLSLFSVQFCLMLVNLKTLFYYLSLCILPSLLKRDHNLDFRIIYYLVYIFVIVCNRKVI
jgi:hypothetical protein